jgi:hypothetical protein
MANTKKGIRELSKNKSKHFFKTRLHPQYIYQFKVFFFFVENVDRMLNQNKGCNFGDETVSNEILNSNSMFIEPTT